MREKEEKKKKSGREKGTWGGFKVAPGKEEEVCVSIFFFILFIA